MGVVVALAMVVSIWLVGCADDPGDPTMDAGGSCGDGWCDGDESAASCPLDCDAVCGDDACTHDEDEVSCAPDCAPVCGDGEVTPDEECELGDSQSCTTTCGSTGTAACSECLWGACELPMESCNGIDDDCDNAADEGFDCVLGAVEPCDFGGGQPGHRECVGACTWGSCICDPDCTGAECGNDGCGGSCGDCTANAVCTGARLCATGSYIFVSSTDVAGAMGGLAGADAFCDQLASDAGLVGTYQAFLSDSSTSVRDRLSFLWPLYGMDGALLAVDETDLYDGWLASALHLDEYGYASPRVHAWTGSVQDGSASPYTCNDWTSNLEGAFAAFGAIDVTDPSWLYKWLYDGEKPCNNPLPVYCVRTQ